jgi:DNA/RNA endonuclease YhcR with UshA esterase domain
VDRDSAESQVNAVCPSCGRFVGTQTRCPWCGARVPKRISLNIVRYGALALALLGLLALWFASRSTDLPLVQIQDIDDTMNWAYIRVQGVVTRYPSYDSDSGYLRFWLDDGTGEIMVAAYRNESETLIESGKVPVPGDRVTIAGTVRIRDDLTSVTIKVPDSLTLERPVSSRRSIGEISPADVTQKVLVRGQVLEVRHPYEDLTILTIGDETGQIDVAYTVDLVQLSGVPPSVETKDLVELSGAVMLYKGRPQLSLESAAALQTLPQESHLTSAPARHLSLNDIPTVQDGTTVSVDALIVRAVPFASGKRFMLQEDNTEALVVFWQDLYDACPDREHLVPGAWVSVQGQVKTYQGDREIVPERADDVVFVEMRGLPPIPDCAIAELSPDQVGHSCEIEGYIRARHPFSKGVRWVVDDGTGQIAVLLWQSVLNELIDGDTFEVGGRVRITGETDVYRGVLELVPALPSDVVWLGAAPTPTASPTVKPTATASATPTEMPTPTEIPATATSPVPTPTPTRSTLATGGVSSVHLGQEVTVEGAIVDIAQFASGIKCYLDDGTGAVALWVAQELFASLPSQDAWVWGSIARARGIVEEYEGEIEIVARIPSGLVITVVADPAPPQITRIAELGPEYVGQRTTVRGQIVEIHPFSKGVNYLLDDGSAKLTLLLWQDVLDVIQDRERLVIGATVQVTGKINEYNGELEIVPGIGSDVVLP